MTSSTRKIGLEALLTPQNSVVVLIDHQPFQFANLHSHEPTMIVNNVIGLAKAAKGFKVPAILTTVMEERGGYIIKGLQDVFPDQKPINRSTLMAFTIADALWVGVSAVVLLIFWSRFTPVAQVLIIATALIVEVFATLQFRAARRARG